MATNKTLNPTGVTIAIPAMADKPDASVFSNCIDKEADAINSLNSNITVITSGSTQPLGENETLQIPTTVFSKKFTLISCQRYGYAGVVALPNELIRAGAYNTGIGLYISDSRNITLKISNDGLITILTANDPVNVNLYGIL